MTQYITRTGQNIYDLCIMFYGSIEGILDLLVCNTSMEITDYGPLELKGKPLTLNTTISRGIVLYYHEDININDNVLDYIDDNDLVVANGQHNITIPIIDPQQVCIVIAQTGKVSTFKGSLLSGSMAIDWGDFSNVSMIEPEDEYEIEHVYNSSGQHTIKIYGSFIANILDFRNINGTIYVTAPIIVRKFYDNGSNSEIFDLITIVGDGWFTIDVDALDTKLIK